MRKIAIIGANSFQNPLILKAKEMGFETHVFAWQDGSIGEKTADYFYPISIVEKEEILEKCREIQPEALPINFLLPIKGTPLGDADISMLTTEYCMKVLCLARLLVPQSDIRCAAGREVYFKGEEKKLLSVVDSIFASGYLTADGQGIKDTIRTITDAGFTYEIESA